MHILGPCIGVPVVSQTGAEWKMKRTNGADVPISSEDVFFSIEILAMR
jgi:hypothetical protein